MNPGSLPNALLHLRFLTRVLASHLLLESHHCPPGEAWKAVRRKVERHQVWLDLKTSARLIREDNGLALWEIGGERYWSPHGSRSLPGLLEERSSGMYDCDPAVGPGDTVLDCGAHIGTFSRHALGRGAARVIAIEPAPANAGCLRRNLADPIAAGQVTVCPIGVWDKETALVLREMPHNPAAGSVALDLRGSRPGPSVRLTTIDALVDDLHLERVDYIKLDVEGAECEALAGARQTLGRWRPRLAIATEHRRDDPERIPRCVTSIRGDYRLRPGPWALGRHSLRPQMLYFH